MHSIEDFKSCSSILETTQVPESHTSLNTATVLANMLNEWETFDKIMTLVIDNPSNMKRAVIEDFKKHHHSCIAHTINLTVNECLSRNTDLSSLLSRCRYIIGHFKHSVNELFEH